MTGRAKKKEFQTKKKKYRRKREILYKYVCCVLNEDKIGIEILEGGKTEARGNI